MKGLGLKEEEKLYRGIYETAFKKPYASDKISFNT